MRKRKWLCFILSFILVVCATGCLSPRSPDEYGYALVIGVDEGKEKPFYISMLLQRSNGDTQGTEGNVCPLVGVECADLFEAVDLIEGGLPFALNLSRVTAVTFSEDVAKNGRIAEFLSVSLGTLQIRYYANMIIAYGRAEDFLKGMQSSLNPNIAKLQYNFVAYGEETGLVPSITLAQFYDRAWGNENDVVLPLGALTQQPEDEEGKEGKKGTSDNGGTIKEALPLPEVDMLGGNAYLPGQDGRDGGLNAQVIGSAVFSGTAQVGMLNGMHTQLLLMASGDFSKGRIHLPLKDGQFVSVLLRKNGKPKATLSLLEQPRASIELSLFASMEEPAATAQMDKHELESMIAHYIENELSEVFCACRARGADVFALGKQAVEQFTDSARWEAYDWASAYKRTEAVFAVQVQLGYNPTISRLE